MAVWGIGSPSGRRNSAVTANQSARAPTMPASAAARTYPTQTGAPACSCHLATTYTTEASSSRPVATAFIRRRARRLVSSSGRGWDTTPILPDGAG